MAPSLRSLLYFFRIWRQPPIRVGLLLELPSETHARNYLAKEHIRASFALMAVPCLLLPAKAVFYGIKNNEETCKPDKYLHRLEYYCD